MPQLTGFIGPSYTLQSTNIQCQRTVNLYPQIDESGTGKNVASLLGTPGLRLFATLDVNPMRGMITTSKGRLFVITYQTLWEVMQDGSKVNRGTLTSSAGFVGIADNGQVLMLVDGPNGYSYDLTSDMLSMPIANFPGGATIAFQDGFFIFNQPNTQVFWITNAYSVIVDPLNFASAEGSPDLLLCLLSDHEMLWLFGSNSTEVWYDSGDPLFPFTKVQGGSIQYGIAANRSAVRFNNSVAWLGQSEAGRGVFYQSQGLQASRISTHAVEQAIAQYPTISDAVSYTYQQDGHEFYVTNFLSGNATWVYDADTQLWHERAYTGVHGLERQRGEIHVEAFGLHIVSDYATGKLYVLDRNALNDAGTSITRIRTSPYVSNGLKNLFVSRLQLDIETGIGPDGETGTPPQCMLDWSDDGGRTWSNQYWTSLGSIGATLTRAIWRRLGRTRQRVFRVTITDDCKVAMVDAFISVTAGMS